MSHANRLKREQRRWAKELGYEIDRHGYLETPEQNLPWLTERTRADFAEADGWEFGSATKRGDRALGWRVRGVS